MYYNGDGVPRNYQEARRWWYSAAEQGNAKAQYHLGLMYGRGEGVPQDFVLAYMWAILAASRETGDERQEIVEFRDQLEERLTREQINKTQQVTSEWKPKRSGSQ